MTVGLNDWTIETQNGQNILFYKGKNYIPKNTDLRQELVKSFHDHETAGHSGKLGHTMQYYSTIGGLDFAHL